MVSNCNEQRYQDEHHGECCDGPCHHIDAYDYTVDELAFKLEPVRQKVDAREQQENQEYVVHNRVGQVKYSSSLKHKSNDIRKNSVREVGLKGLILVANSSIQTYDNYININYEGEK